MAAVKGCTKGPGLVLSLWCIWLGYVERIIELTGEIPEEALADGGAGP